MKILFCGPLLDFSGFSTAARNFLRCLDASQKFDLVARTLKYDKLDEGQKYIPAKWLDTLLKKDIQNVDVCMQMTTCNSEAQPVPKVLNILYTFLESDRIQKSWAAKANEFDLLIVPCQYNAEAMSRSGVTKPIIVCPPPCDSSAYIKDYHPFKISNTTDRIIFYNISQLSWKKGIDALIRAYYAAFADMPDKVLLVLKTYINMVDRSKDLEQIKQYIERIKSGCRIPVQSLPPILPITKTLSEDEIHALHQRGDVYVSASRAEGMDIPLFDSLCHGNVAITNIATGHEIFVRKDNSLVYGGTQGFFFDMHHPDPGLYTGIEQCFEPSPVEIAYLMKKYVLLRSTANKTEEEQKEWDSILLRQKNAKKIADVFDYNIAHKKITPIIEKSFEQWKISKQINLKEMM